MKAAFNDIWDEVDPSQTRQKVEEFKRRRASIRLALFVIVALALVATALANQHPAIKSSLIYEIAGGVIFLSFVAYAIWVKRVMRCPACKASFSRPSKEYDEGVPILNRLDSCPFCGVPIDKDADEK